MRPDFEIPDAGVRLYCGDCAKVQPHLAAGSVAAIVTDPPYGTDPTGRGYGRHGGGKGRDYRGCEKRSIANDKDQSALAGMAAWQDCLKPDAWVIAFCGSSTRLESAQVLLESGLAYYGEFVWFKLAIGLGTGIRYAHESAQVFTRGSPRKTYSCSSVIQSLQRRLPFHPHEKPVEIMRELVQFAAAPGQLVLDPFMGTGATGRACIQLGRPFIGVELDRRYFDRACDMLAQEWQQKAATGPLLSMFA